MDPGRGRVGEQIQQQEMVGWLNVMGNNLLPFLAMVMVVLSQSGGMVVSKAAMGDGMNKYVMVAYSYVLSTFVLLPFALLQFYRSERPPLTFSSLCSFFLLALIGCLCQILGFAGIELSSPMLASAMLNLIPGFTFVLAVICRMEEVYWRCFTTQAKVLGTTVSIAGAFVVIFFKGPPIFKTHSVVSSNILQYSQQVNWILGGFFCVGESLSGSIWYIYQASITKKYPAIVVIVFFLSLFSIMQSTVFALFAVREPGAWVLRLDIGLVAILYQAIGANAVRFILMTWCVRRAGPLFCAMFKPMGIIFTIFMDAVFLRDDFHLGSFIGAILIMVGFYFAMWGKASEEKMVKRGIEHLESSCHNVPLLQNKT